jgi:YHS domain-containing protein
LVRVRRWEVIHVARDPVCGMNVRDDNRNNLRSEFRGRNYYFCSDKCRQEFDQNPNNFTRDDDRRLDNRDDRDNRNDVRNRDRNMRNDRPR